MFSFLFSFYESAEKLREEFSNRVRNILYKKDCDPRTLHPIEIEILEEQKALQEAKEQEERRMAKLLTLSPEVKEITYQTQDEVVLTFLKDENDFEK